MPTQKRRSFFVPVDTAFREGFEKLLEANLLDMIIDHLDAPDVRVEPVDVAQ
jgi:hypothetical protein